MVDDSITGNLRACGSARMSAPPEANVEYSRGSEPSGGLLARVSARSSAPREGPGTALAAVAVTAACGALLILLAQFAALYQVHVTTISAPIRTVGTGGNHAWAPVPVALLAAGLAFAVYRKLSRTTRRAPRPRPPGCTWRRWERSCC